MRRRWIADRREPGVPARFPGTEPVSGVVVAEEDVHPRVVGAAVATCGQECAVQDEGERDRPPQTRIAPGGCLGVHGAHDRSGSSRDGLGQIRFRSTTAGIGSHAHRVADAAHRSDPTRAVADEVDLLAEVRDVHVDHMVVADVVVSPDGGQELGSRQYGAGPLRQREEQIELDLGQFGRPGRRPPPIACRCRSARRPRCGRLSCGSADLERERPSSALTRAASSRGENGFVM